MHAGNCGAPMHGSVGAFAGRAVASTPLGIVWPSVSKSFVSLLVVRGLRTMRVTNLEAFAKKANRQRVGI
ncbi:hypothetical protein ASG68_21630 [Rhizobium sp. Leaf453]|nr:hypothetical protein ASG68_21630 [Rhizobium sp. Leaf453]